MKLAEILGIKAGALIKGIRIDENHSLGHRRNFLSLDGWMFNNVPLEKPEDPDQTLHFVSLVLVPDPSIKPLLGQIKHISEPSDISVKKLMHNQDLLRHVHMNLPDFCPFTEGSVLGMSLGESIVSFVPQYPNIYKNDYYQIMCWHKILIVDKVAWLKMTSNIRINSSSIVDVRGHIADSKMELD